jgi:hypothetical protein
VWVPNNIEVLPLASHLTALERKVFKLGLASFDNQSKHGRTTNRPCETL